VLDWVVFRLEYLLHRSCSQLNTTSIHPGVEQMRFLNTPIDVIADSRGRPRIIAWKGRRYRVIDISEVWISRGRWWAREDERIFMRVETDAAQFVVYRSGCAWISAWRNTDQQISTSMTPLLKRGNTHLSKHSRAIVPPSSPSNH